VKLFMAMAGLLVAVLVCGPGSRAVAQEGGVRGAGAAESRGQVSNQDPFAPLQDVIERYRRLALEYNWPPVMRTGSIQPGERHAVLADIRHRLVILGDLAGDAVTPDPWLLDDNLRLALERFQRRHGLDVDGIFGRRSRAALDVEPRQRYRQLLLNQARQRQFRQQLGAQDTYVLVNIPAFEMRYVEAGQPALRMRAIVGKAKARTPLVASQIDSVELNPDWDVPRGIAYRDILPDLETSPDYLQRNGIELVVGHGDSMRSLPQTELDVEHLYHGPRPQQRFWQAPGPDNPLGQLKFNFPNPYLVYMHGTPSSGLFDEPVRDFSSGCIRIEYPDQLARRLFGLAEPQGVAAVSRLEREMASGENRVLSLPRPVAVYTTYWTAWLEDDGQVQFRDDIYGRDEQDQADLGVLERETALSRHADVPWTSDERRLH